MIDQVGFLQNLTTRLEHYLFIIAPNSLAAGTAKTVLLADH